MNLRQRPPLLQRSNTKPARPSLWARLNCGIIAAVFGGLSPSPALARESLGVFGSWAAFRDTAPPHCFAIAAPVQRHPRARWAPFVAVADWPARGARGQIHVRLRATSKPGAPISLSIGEAHFRLTGSGPDAWAADAGADRAIVAAMRGGSSLSIETTDSRGKPLVDVYRLGGAATAIDAAALGCARRL
jgi:hypothetical protein